MVNSYSVDKKNEEMEELPKGLKSNFQWGSKKK